MSNQQLIKSAHVWALALVLAGGALGHRREGWNEIPGAEFQPEQQQQHKPATRTNHKTATRIRPLTATRGQMRTPPANRPAWRT